MQATTERKHQPYSPSKVVMWQKCPGWKSDGTFSEAAKRGTLIGEGIAHGFLGLTFSEECLPYIDEITKGCELASDFLNKCGYNAAEWDITAEPFVSTGVDGCGGFADIVATQSFGTDAILIEIKTGRGDRASAEESLQVASYAIGLLLEGCERVHCALIEVDKGTSTECSYITSDIPAVQLEITNIINRHLSANPEQYQNGGYCSYCGNATTCPKLTGSIAEVESLLPEVADPKEYAESLTTEALGSLLSKVTPIFDRADAYYGALRARAMQIIESGGDVPGWTVKYTNGNRAWSNELATMQTLLSLGLNASDICKLISPAKVESLLKAKGMKPKDMLAGQTKTGASKKSLTEVK